MTGSSYDLRLTHAFPQSASKVFDAWTRPDELARWWRFPGYSIPTARVAVDPRVGGVWTVVGVSDDDNSEIPFTGEIREIEPNARLVIELVDEPDPDAAVHSRMEINVSDTAEGSEMVFHHHGFGSTKGMEELRAGYTTFFFPSLAEFLATR